MADPTNRAIQKCGHWLVECLRLGWSRDRLDALEALWWEHHDERGNLKPASGASAPTPTLPDLPDARRYRWLRENALEQNEAVGSDGVFLANTPVLVVSSIGVFDDDRTLFDSEIDAAM